MGTEAMPADHLHKQGGRWPKGRSGNPAGRRHGSRNKATLALEKIMADDAQEVVRAVVAAARGGDMQAAKLILDRVAPIRRGRPVALRLPAVGKAEDLPGAVAAVVRALGEGELTPEEAAAVVGVLEGQCKALEVAELEARVARLEEQQGRR